MLSGGRCWGTALRFGSRTYSRAPLTLKLRIVSAILGRGSDQQGHSSATKCRRGGQAAPVYLGRFNAFSPTSQASRHTLQPWRREPSGVVRQMRAARRLAWLAGHRADREPSSWRRSRWPSVLMSMLSRRPLFAMPPCPPRAWKRCSSGQARGRRQGRTLSPWPQCSRRTWKTATIIRDANATATDQFRDVLLTA
jgi:hypothetical protein